MKRFEKKKIYIIVILLKAKSFFDRIWVCVCVCVRVFLHVCIKKKYK